MINAPTGVGKSGVAITVGLAFGEIKRKTILTTPLKMLQSQYSNDFSNYPEQSIAEIKGRSNYTCVNSPKFTGKSSEVWTCEEGPGATIKDSCSNCPYVMARNKASFAQIALMNTAYYMGVKYGKSFRNRKILIIDEAHSLADHVLNSCEVKITNRIMTRAFPEMPTIPKYSSLEQYEQWFNDIVESCSVNISEIMKSFKGIDIKDYIHVPDIKKKIKEMNRYKRLKDNVKRYLDNRSGLRWVWEYTEDNKNPINSSIVLKPLDVSRFVDDYVFNEVDKVILMSATLLNKRQMCRELGIDEKEAVWIECESPFNPANHRFMTASVGKLNYQEIDKTLPKLTKLIREIMSYHPTEKGIIHCNSFRISDYIAENINDRRLLIQKQGSSNEEVLKKHKKSKNPTVIVSPSMTEGVDLVDDLSRWQIIVKLPFAFLGDKYIKTKAEMYPDWYLYKMVLTFVQAMGRPIRHNDDWAITYCLDPSFQFFIQHKACQEGMIPDHIRKIIFRSK